MRPEDRPRGCLRFLDDRRGAGRTAWRHCKPPLFVILAGLAHFPVAFLLDLGDYRWVLVGLGSLSIVVGFACLHLLMLGLDRIAITRAEARAARAEAEEDSSEEGHDR